MEYFRERILVFVLAAFLVWNPSPASSSCLSRFETERAHFEPCLKKPCMLFLPQEPYVVRDPDMKGVESQKLFSCNQPTSLFPKLGGIAFDVHKEIRFDALCVYAGDNCTFNGMTLFVSERAKDPKTKDYMFGVQGMIAQLPSRLTPTLRTSITIAEAPYIIIKSNQGDASNAAKMFYEVHRAFDPETWYAIFGVLAFFALLSTFASFVLSGSISPPHIINTMRGHVFENDEGSASVRVLKRTSTSLIGTGLSILILLTILFYEIGVVNYIFSGQNESLTKSLKEFQDLELKPFGEPRGSASESTLIEAVDPYGKRFSNGTFPWVRCNSLKSCFTRLLDPKDPTQFTIAFEPEANYWIQGQKACDKITVLDTTSNSALSFNGGRATPHGWYLSTSVPASILQQLNENLLGITLSGRLKNITTRSIGAGNGKCEKQKLSIAVEVLMLPLAMLVGPIVAVIVVFLFQFKKPSPNNHEGKVDDENRDIDAIMQLSS